MKRALLATCCIVAITGPSAAQQATAVGTGIAASRSDSKATAVGVGGTAVGGGVGNTGTVNNTNNPTAAIISNTTAPASTTQTITTQGTTSVRTVPSVFAPGLAAAGIESCLGSVSGGGSWLGTGISLGGSVPDRDCSARLDARTLWAFGLKKAAVARICLTADVYNSMPDVCSQYLAHPPIGYAPVAAPVVYGEVPYNGGDIWLSHDGGPQQLCHDYDQPNQRCRVWAGVKHHPASKKRLRGDAISATTAALQKEDTTK
jgi:hypothetical protein